jgi:urea transporter
MKYKIEVDYHQIYSIWLTTVQFISDKMEHIHTPQDVVILEQIHKLSVRMLKKAFKLRFKGKNEVENFGFDFMEIQLIQMPISGICLFRVLLLENNNSAVWALDQKVKSM